MSGHWVYTPRTLPPRVLFPEPSQEQNEETASPSENDDPAGVTPVRVSCGAFGGPCG